MNRGVNYNAVKSITHEKSHIQQLLYTFFIVPIIIYLNMLGKLHI